MSAAGVDARLAEGVVRVGSIRMSGVASVFGQIRLAARGQPRFYRKHDRRASVSSRQMPERRGSAFGNKGGASKSLAGKNSFGNRRQGRPRSRPACVRDIEQPTPPCSPRNRICDFSSFCLFGNITSREWRPQAKNGRLRQGKSLRSRFIHNASRGAADIPLSRLTASQTSAFDLGLDDTCGAAISSAK
jgi:hypothetical protein